MAVRELEFGPVTRSAGDALAHFQSAWGSPSGFRGIYKVTRGARDENSLVVAAIVTPLPYACKRIG